MERDRRTELDIDGDLDKLFYAKGEHTAGEFANGTVEGTAFTVNEKDMAAFQITEKGTYTFYAVDKNGNGAVKIAKFVSESDGPGAFQYDPDGRNAGGNR